MPEPSSLETIRAALDTLAPSIEEMPGALALGADGHLVELLEMGLPGISDMFAGLLDAYAGEVRARARFVDLDGAERDRVLRAMSTDDSQDIRDAVDALIVFGFGGTFSEWSGYDEATGALQAPATWAAVGFNGPVPGHPDYREGV